MSTPNRMQILWKDVRPFILKEWPKFSETVLNDIDGNYDRFLKHLKAIYHNFPLEEAMARDKLNRSMNKVENI